METIIPAKYPKQIESIKRNNITLAVVANFNVPQSLKNEKTGEFEATSPLEKTALSRFVVSLVDKTIKMQPTANIPAHEILLIKKKTDFCIQKMLFLGTQKQSEGIETVTLSIGEFKGKAPSNILIDNPNNLDALIKHKDMLKNNLSKPEYAKFADDNKKKILAIEKAVADLKNGTLQKGAETSIEIYNSDIKYFRTKREDGKYKIYKIRMLFDITKNYPYSIEISNGFADVKFNENGTTNILYKTTQDRISKEISLTEMEFSTLVDRLYIGFCNYQTMMFPKQYALADGYEYEQRAAHTAQKSEESQTPVAKPDSTNQANEKPSNVFHG